MKTLHFNKTNDLSQLHDQLLAAIPSLAKTRLGKDGFREEMAGNMRVEGRGDEILLTVENRADEAAIGAVVDAHVPVVVIPFDYRSATNEQRMDEIARRLGLI